MTHYQRPGLVPLAVPGSPGAGRCVFQASNGDGYIIVGDTVYYVAPDWTLTSVGSIASTTSLATGASTPCSMVDNGTEILIVNGKPYAGNATGNILFTVNPSNGDTITLNGVTWTFVSATPGVNETLIGVNTAFTILTLVNDLRASTDPGILEAGYTFSAQNAPDEMFLWVVYKEPGAIGTGYTLAASAATPSAANLELGVEYPGTGWTLALGDLSPTAVTVIPASEEFSGADRVDFIDTFIVWNVPGTRNFRSTTSNTILPLDPLYIAGKTGWPDPIQGIIVNREQILLPGTIKSEFWYNSGNPTFPFTRLSGTFVEHGVIAKYSICSADLNIYFLSKDLQGKGYVLRIRGNETKRISNFALEYQISQMTDITDAVGYTYQVGGHLFYVLSFPAADQTWVWDESVGEPELGWSQRGWTGTDGVLHRDRGVLGAWLYGKNVVLDWENGTLYEQSMTTFTDTVDDVEYPITYLRTFPHLMMGTDQKTGEPVLANGRIVQHNRFAIDVECGNSSGQSPKFSLRWSDTRGASWGMPVLLHAGAQGEYGTRPDAQGLGQAMDRVYELSWNFPGQVALNGAWVEGTVTNR